jgi:hypothetical protein
MMTAAFSFEMFVNFYVSYSEILPAVYLIIDKHLLEPITVAARSKA